MCFAAVRKAGHDHTVLATSGCDSSCPVLKDGLELNCDPPELKALAAMAAYNPLIPCRWKSVLDWKGQEQRGLKNGEHFSETVLRSEAQHQPQRDGLST